MQNYNSFDHFTMNYWKYLSNSSDRAWHLMSDKEKVDFNFDVTSIDWATAEGNFLYGIRRYFLKEDVLPPEAHFRQLLAKDRIELFHDARLAYSITNTVASKSNTAYFDGILNPKLFNEFVERRNPAGINKKIGIKAKNPNDAAYVGKETNTLLFDNEKAQEQIAELKSEITSSGMRSLVYMFNKNMRRAI